MVSGLGSGRPLAFEDLAPGQRETFGPRVLSKEEIVAFGKDWDPQPFHVDEAAAARSPFGGLIASGWQTAALCMRLVVDGLLAQSTSMGSPGLDKLRWLKPVRPGDALSVEVAILETTPSRQQARPGQRPAQLQLHQPEGRDRHDNGGARAVSAAGGRAALSAPPPRPLQWVGPAAGGRCCHADHAGDLDRDEDLGDRPGDE